MELVRRTRPDLAVFDLEMPNCDGLTPQPVRAEQDIPIMTSPIRAAGRVEAEPGRRCPRIRAKTTAASRLAEILRDVHAGKRYVDPEIAASALTATSCPLTERELELLRYAHTGSTVGAIAERARLAPGTVRNYLSSAMSKLGVSTRYEAARRAWEEGWI